MNNSIIEQYKKQQSKRYLLLILLCCIALILVFCSLMTGAYHISFENILKCFVGSRAKVQNVVIFNLRLPRTVSAIISGGGLAVSGLTIQRLLKNPLASPFTIGIS